MNRIKLLAILNRNNENNPLLKWILEVGKEKEKETNVDIALKDRMKRMFSGNEEQ